MTRVPPRIVLASASPRRRALLAALGLDFEVIVSSIDEPGGFQRFTEGGAEAEVVAMARAKRDDVASRLDSPAVVIAADTLVFVAEHVLGKPAGPGQARAMLAALSGKTHQVITGVAVLDSAAGKLAEGAETTAVTFRALSDREITRFVETVNPVDRAGAYTVDGPGSLLVAGYSGCYQNVLGLPMVRLDILLQEIGYNLFDLMDASRCQFL